MKLDELGFVGRGKSKHRPRNDPSLYGGHYPFVQTGDVKAADLWLSHYTQTYNKAGLAQSKLWPAGTLCITIAANIAETAILKIPACFPDSIVGFIPHEGKADARFVKYYIDTIKLRMQNVSKGTTQDNLSVDKLLSVDFDVPDYPTQGRIASILCAYDDLIENNTRRIKILEEMAQTIYREWFVNFRFPGHERVKLVETEMGRIPEGWNIGALANVCSKVASGGTPSRKDASYWIPPTVDWFKTKELRDGYLFNSDEKISETGYRESSAKLFPSDTVVMAIYAAPTVGRLGILTRDATFNQAACGLVPDPNICSTSFLYYVLLALRPYFNRIAQGAAQQNISVEKVKDAKLMIPPIRLVRDFDSVASPILSLVRILSHKNCNLRATRDLLLPKVIAGEVSVGALETETASQIS